MPVVVCTPLHISDAVATPDVEARLCEAPRRSHGVDIDEDGNGLLRDGRLYQLVRQDGAVREQTLQITFLDHGAEAYAFTFG